MGRELRSRRFWTRRLTLVSDRRLVRSGRYGSAPKQVDAILLELKLKVWVLAGTFNQLLHIFRAAHPSRMTRVKQQIVISVQPHATNTREDLDAGAMGHVRHYCSGSEDRIGGGDLGDRGSAGLPGIDGAEVAGTKQVKLSQGDEPGE